MSFRDFPLRYEMRGGSLKMFLRCGWFCIRCHFPWVCSWGWATQGGIEFQRVVFSCVHFCFSILVLSFCLRSLSLHPLQKKILSGASFSRISINLRDECDYNIFFTGKKTNLILSTLTGGLGTTSPAICSSGDLPRGGKIRARKYWIWQAKR